MKAICIDNSQCRTELTIGKTYTIISASDDGYYRVIRDDNNREDGYFPRRFKLIDSDLIEFAKAIKAAIEKTYPDPESFPEWERICDTIEQSSQATPAIQK
jgi:hypothetical protein